MAEQNHSVSLLHKPPNILATTVPLVELGNKPALGNAIFIILFDVH